MEQSNCFFGICTTLKNRQLQKNTTYGIVQPSLKHYSLNTNSLKHVDCEIFTKLVIKILEQHDSNSYLEYC